MTMPKKNIITQFQQRANQLLGWEDQSEKLLDLIYINDLPGVTKMLDEGADVNVAPLMSLSRKGETPLTAALVRSGRGILRW